MPMQPMGDAVLGRQPLGELVLVLLVVLDLEHAPADLGLRQERLLVLEHQRRDAHAVVAGVAQQLLARVERVRDLDLIGRCRTIGRCARMIDDEAAADRVIDPLDERRAGAGRPQAGEPHAVRVQRQLVAAVEDQRLLEIEVDLARAEQADALRRRHLCHALLHAVDVARRGLVALEAENDRLVAAVTLAGEAERAEQLDLHARRLRELAVGFEALDEALGGAHRADGV